MANSLAYIASPYSRYSKGLDAAFMHIARIAARLRTSGVFTYCPITHLHPLAHYGNLDPMDLSIWVPHNHVMMERCDCLIVAQMEGWDQSDGVKAEIEYFRKMDKPIFDLDVTSFVMTKRVDENDPRMQLTLDDVKAFSGGHRELPPLAHANPKGQ